LTLVAVIALCACSSPQQRIINDAAAALGGSEKVSAVKTLTIEGEGSNGNLGQDMTPEATSQTFKVTEYKRVVDLAAGRARVEQTRTPNFTYFQGPVPQKQVQGIDGNIGFNVAPNGTATRTSNAAAKDRRVEIYHHPIAMVRAALNPAANVANARTQNNLRVADITTADGLTLTLAIDNSTKLPVWIASKTDNTNLGDVAIQTSFADYQNVNGLQLPTRLTTKTDNYTTADIRVLRQSFDGETGDLSAPAAATAATPITGTEPATVTADEVAKGIWFLAGQSHHSVLVEFDDHLTLIETPQNDTRSLAVIAKARELRPGKPLTQVIITHHHFDHSGGIRAAVAEGLTLITDKASAAFYQEAVGRPHTILPDALVRNPKPLKVEAVDSQMVLQDKTMTVNLYHIDGSPHADTMLMAYFPRERILVEADLYNPAAMLNPFAANLVDNVKKRNLRVDRIIPIHGTIVPYTDLVKAVRNESSSSN
jgi:glyoxylase-like metal-dependent hydrolase (beta-lactamase superfamily II)